MSYYRRMKQNNMKLTEYISFFHRRRTGQLSAEDAQAPQQEQDPDLDQELEQLWSDSLDYHSGYEPDVDKGLSRLKCRMEADRAREAKTIPFKSESRRWMGIAAAIALVAALGGAWFMAQNHGADGLVFTTAADEQSEIRLPDESVVYLNEHSYLSYAQVEGQRVVSLTGEAYFNVASNPKVPFVIHANGVRTTVLGTAFNLRAYPDEPTVEVEVSEGHVRMEEPRAAKSIDLQPQERGVFRTQQQTLSKKPAPELNAKGWRSQRMVFRDAELSGALKEIGRYYKVDFKLKNPELHDCALTTEIEADPLSDFLEVLKTIYGLDIQQTASGSYVLSGGRCS